MPFATYFLRIFANVCKGLQPIDTPQKESAELNLAVQRRAWKAQLSDAKYFTADLPGRLCGSLFKFPAAGRQRGYFPIHAHACQPPLRLPLRIAESAKQLGEGRGEVSIVNRKS